MQIRVVHRVLIGSAALGVVGAAWLAALGRPDLVLPALGGVGWGIVNVVLLRRVVAHVRPDPPVDAGRLAVDLAVKFPAMYAVAFLLLWKRPLPVVVTAAAGFGVVLLVLFLRAIYGALRHPAGSADRSRTVQGA